MYYNETNIREQMTLFWHDHFATSAQTIFYPPAMYHQNRKLRENSLGNFKDLVTLMTFDPAMMIWLDNNQNIVDNINENFARELLELFTLGEGNYLQEDIVEAARGLTGYSTDGLNVYYYEHLHDDRLKKFLGKTGFWKLFSPHYPGPWGENRGYFPPHYLGPWGKNKLFSLHFLARWGESDWFPPILKQFPPIFRDPGGKMYFVSPHFSRPWGES